MFLIRQATLDDAPMLLKLAKMVHFINLPADSDLIHSRVVHSRRSFRGQVEERKDMHFTFVLEETETGNVIGTSSIVSAISSPGNPQVFLTVRRREHFSEALQTGHTHVTLQIGTDESGPSELGGLILGPSYRGHKERLGSLLSLIRFHYIGLHRERFADKIIAEMMGALTPDSSNMLWDYLGRRFINLDYTEADLFSQDTNTFIIELFPKEEIYATLLPAQARSLIGKVGPETEPAKAMLERLGFEYRGRVDPFDAGPYLEAVTGEIPLVAATRTATLVPPRSEFAESGFVSVNGTRGFRATRSAFALQGDEISLPPETVELLGAELGEAIGVTPRPRDDSTADAPGAARRQETART